MEYKFIGYVKYSYLVFYKTSSVYEYNGKKFITVADEKTHCITEFYQISGRCLENIVEISLDNSILKKVGDQEFFVFLTDDSGDHIFGEYSQIEERLKSLFEDKRTNIYAKKGIASFLRSKEFLKEVFKNMLDHDENINNTFLKEEIKKELLEI